MSARFLFVVLTIATLSSSAEGTRLFATYTGPAGPSGASLWEVDPMTGATQLVAGLPNRVWGDISGRAGETTGVYSVARVPGGDFQNQVSRIDVQSGAVSDLYAFTASDFGFAADNALELRGISIAQSLPSVATITGSVFDLTFQSDPTTILFDLDLETGAVSGLQTLLTALTTDLTHASDESLFTILSQEPRRLGTIDRSNGSVNEIGTCQGCSIRAIEFDPISGELFGVDVNGELLRLSPTTGSTLEVRGQTGLGNEGGPASVTGLAFVVPEPGTGFLLLLGFVGLAARRR